MSTTLFCPVRRTDGFRGLPTFDYALACKEASDLGLQWTVELVEVPEQAPLHTEDQAAFERDMALMSEEPPTDNDLSRMAQEDEIERIDQLNERRLGRAWEI